VQNELVVNKTRTLTVSEMRNEEDGTRVNLPSKLDEEYETTKRPETIHQTRDSLKKSNINEILTSALKLQIFTIMNARQGDTKLESLSDLGSDN